jgi:hypothetical protein
LLRGMREETMKELSVLGVTLAASVLCATPISLYWSPNTNTSAVRRQRQRSNRTTAHTYECGGCEEKGASTCVPALLLLR